MIKLMFFCRRRPDVSHETYADRLLRGHVPLALAHHPTMLGYVVNVVEAVPPGWPPLDSIGELTFATFEDFSERLYDDAQGREAVERDVAGFLGGAVPYVATEHVQKSDPGGAAVGTRSPGVKLVCPVRRRHGMTHDAFVEHWLGRHVPLALRHHPGLSKYVTNVVKGRLSEEGEDLDGVAELHFPSEAVLASGMFDSPDGERTVREDMARFIGRTGAYRVAEWVQKRG